MALKTGGDLETVSLVLTKDQVQQIRTIRDTKKRDYNRISVSDVAREVVALGLEAFHCALHSDKIASDAISEGEAA